MAENLLIAILVMTYIASFIFGVLAAVLFAVVRAVTGKKAEDSSKIEIKGE